MSTFNPNDPRFKKPAAARPTTPEGPESKGPPQQHLAREQYERPSGSIYQQAPSGRQAGRLYPEPPERAATPPRQYAQPHLEEPNPRVAPPRAASPQHYPELAAQQRGAYLYPHRAESPPQYREQPHGVYTPPLYPERAASPPRYGEQVPARQQHAWEQERQQYQPRGPVEYERNEHGVGRPPPPMPHDHPGLQDRPAAQGVPGQRGPWTTGLFDCCSYTDASCVVTYFIPGVTYGGVTERTTGSSCGLAFFLWCCASCCIPIAVPFMYCSLRQDVRAKYNLEGGACEDCLISYFCGLCSLCQMDREGRIRAGELRPAGVPAHNGPLNPPGKQVMY